MANKYTLRDLKYANRVINGAVENLGVDLSGLTVLTEVGSGPYLFTPIIASRCGAETVYAWTFDSEYGLSSDIVQDCKRFCKEISISNIEFLENTVLTDHIAAADIITNSGFLRPLNSEKLKHCKKEVVIPLMYDKWEFRSFDIDIDFCRINKIPVAGTWENHPSLKIFDAIGALGVKMILETKREVWGNNIFVWSDDNFGNVLSETFIKLGAHKVITSVDQNLLINTLSEIDILFLANYYETSTFFRDIIPSYLVGQFDEIVIIHLFGSLDYIELSNKGLNIFPEKDGKESEMSLTLGYLGLNPIIKLQVAGLKVAECMARGLRNSIMQPIVPKI